MKKSELLEAFEKDRTGIYLEYTFKDSRGEDQPYQFEVPFEGVVKGIRIYFEVHNVGIDSTDNALYNVITDLGADIESIINDTDYVRDDLKKEYQQEAQDEFTSLQNAEAEI